MIYKTEHINVEQLAPLMQEFIEESFFNCNVNPTKLQNLINYPNVLTIVAYDNEEPVGIIMASVYDHPIFDTRISSDIIFYVKKTHRGGFIAVKLIKMYKAWALNRSANYTSVGQSSKIGNIEKVKSFFQKMEFEVTGFNCVKEN